MSEQDSTQSGKSSESPLDSEFSYDEEKWNQIMAQIKEFSRLITMEMKWHITPVFGCFEFLECSFVLDSNYDLRFRTIDSNSSIFSNIPNWTAHKASKKVNEENKESGCKKCHTKHMTAVIGEGVDIILQLHQLEWIRVEKSTFRDILATIKRKEKYSYDFLYTDFE